MVGVSHLGQTYASLWFNPAVRIDKKTIFWRRWLGKGIEKIGDVSVEGVMLPLDIISQKYNLEKKDNF